VNFKYSKNRSKDDILQAINLLILFCRKNDASALFLFEDLEDRLIQLESLLK